MAFVGPCPEGMECRHLDGNPGNNNLENLAWGTREENMKDRVDHGVSNRGTRNGMVLLKSEDVLWMRANFKSGGTAKYVGAFYTMCSQKFGISRGTVKRIVSGKSWEHLL